MESNVTSNTKQSVLPGHNRLKKFTIPKRTPDKDFLSDCSTNQRDYHEVKERLNQGCFDRECDLGSLCHFDKIEMVHNKDLEEEFVAKRTKMREQGRMDKELSSFLVVSKDEVPKICQSGLWTSNSIKKDLDIMRELGNPQLGVYLFRHVDIALNYASKYSIQVEYIIIFRVLLGKVKKVQPPKGKKKVALDPTPNYDCHVSRIHPSLKDSIEDQAIGSLVYFYEYSELSKPVDRPRQCLPHAVVKVRVKQKVRAGHPGISLKFGPKRFSKGRGRGHLLENCTVVTRIGNSKLIYEHFHKPKNSAVSDNVSVDISPFSESSPNWNCSGTETQGSKMKQKLPGRWDSAQVETDVWNFKGMPDAECNGDTIRNHIGSYSKNPNDASINHGELSTTITSKLIKDPRLMKKGENPQEQNGETTSHGILQCENELKYQTEMKTSTTLSIPWPEAEELFLLNNSRHMVSEEQYMSKTLWKDRVSGEHQLPLNSNGECSANNEHTIVNLNQFNREIKQSAGDQTHAGIFEQNKLQEMAHFGKYPMNEIPEQNNWPVVSSSEKASDCIGEMEENSSKKLEDCIDNVKDWMNISHILDSENSGFDFNLSFQDKCSLTESQLLKIERDKEKLSDVSDPSLLTKFTSPTTEDTALTLLASTPVLLECVKDTDVKHPTLENPSHSKNENLGALNSSLLHNTVPERFEQELAVECTDINTPDLEVKSETEILSEGYKKCASMPQHLISHTEMSPEEADPMYEYLRERIAWEDLLAKPSSDTEISRWNSLKKDKNVCACEEKIDEGEKATKMVNTYVRPDLQITVANVSYRHHSSLKMRTGMGKLVTKCSEQKKGSKWSQEKNEKSTVDQKNSRIYHQEKVLNTHCPSEMTLPFPKGQSETFEQSEKHIKNMLHTLNTQASMCKNKYLSRKINGAVFHLKKAQRSVQKYLKILARTIKKKRNTSNSHKIVLSNLLESPDRASYNVMSVPKAGACFAEQESPEISKLSSPIDMREAGEKNNSRLESLIESKEDGGCNTDVCESNVKTSTARPVEKSSGKVKPSNPGDTSKLLPIFNRKDTSSVEKEAGEISPAQQNNISMHADMTQACDLSQALVPVVKSKYATRNTQVLLTPQIHGSGYKTKTNNSSEQDLNKICSEEQVERQGLYENQKFKSLAKPENNTESQVTHKKSVTNRQTSVGHENVVKYPLRGQETMISTCARDKVLSKDRGLSSEHANNCKNVTNDTRLPVEVEQTALGFIMQISEILQIADETSCLSVLQEQVTGCKNILPLFIRALEEKQGCSFEHVLVSRENAEKSMRAKLKAYAIESFIDLQIIMETIEFLENKRRYLQGKHTFRSLLWFDDSLCIELFGNRSGYQQQSHLYPTFQRGLKYNAFNELQSHHKKLVEKYEITRLENKSYYCLLKLRREIKECEAAVRSNSLLSDFFYSEPYVCGANFGDTVEDLENARKSTVGLINTCRSLSSIPLGPEKMEHLEIIMNIISTKIEFIRAHEEGNIKSSFIGLEHIFFNAAISFVLREKSIWEGEQIYEAALPKLYEIYENRVEKLENTLIVENDLYPMICIGEILDEAQSVNLEKLRQYHCKCKEQLEIIKKYFQIVQEEDVDQVLITEENVLSFMESSGLKAIRLKPEAVEVYTDLAMVHETLCFIQNSIARKEDKPRFRSLLWCDVSLVNELFHCQEKMASFSYRNDDLLESIESAISDLQDELNVVYDYAESFNCCYARQLLTRELEELLETRKYLQMSASSVCMCVDVVPYSIALNYGSTVAELEYNYEQFYSLLEKLLLEEKKDLGKMAQVLKILKTIEHMKFICMKQEKPPLHLVICQMLKNWRKSRWLKKQAVTKQIDANGSSGMKHKRPAGITSEESSFELGRTNDSFDSKKKKVFAASMTTKKQEKEICRNMRKGERPKALEKEELQLRISTESTWNKKDECLRDRPPLSPSYSKGLKVAGPLGCTEFSSSVSSPGLVHSNTSDSQKNPADLKDLTQNWKGCSKENNQDCFASCDKRGKAISVSPHKDPSPQNSPEGSFISVTELSGDSTELLLVDQHCDLKQDAIGSVSSSIPSCCTAPLELDSSDEAYEKKSVANHEATPNSDSSAIPELSKCVELESSCSDPFFTENTQPPVQFSCFDPNERREETPHIHNYSVYTYRTVYPSYSCHFYQTGSSCHQVTQTYQEFSSYEMHQLTPTMLTATSMVYNTQSSTFYSQSYSHFGVGESQRFNFVQTYPVHSYFSSTVPFPYSCQQWPSWYAESYAHAYPYSSNIGV